MFGEILETPTISLMNVRILFSDQIALSHVATEGIIEFDSRFCFLEFFSLGIDWLIVFNFLLLPLFSRLYLCMFSNDFRISLNVCFSSLFSGTFVAIRFVTIDVVVDYYCIGDFSFHMTGKKWSEKFSWWSFADCHCNNRKIALFSVHTISETKNRSINFPFSRQNFTEDKLQSLLVI